MDRSQILVVEDDPINAQTIKQDLVGLGYAVPRIAHSGPEAIARAHELQPALLLMDIDLGGEMDGVTVASIINKTLDIPTVYLTALHEEGLLERIPGTSAYGVLSKPIDDDTLHSTIELALRKHRQHQARSTSIARLEVRYQALIEAAPDAMVFTNREGVIQLLNQQAVRMFGYPVKELIGQPVESLMPDSQRHAHIHLRQKYTDQPVAMAMGEGMDRLGLRKDGSTFPLEIKLSPIHSDDDLMIAASIRDVSQQKAVQESLRLSRQRYQIMYDNNPLMLFTIDRRGTLLSVNAYGAQQLGYRADELTGRNIASLVSPGEAEVCMDFLRTCFEQDQDTPHSINLCKVRKNGEIIRARETARLITSAQGAPELLIVCEDITQTYQLSRKLAFQASHDSLTDLINRREFEQRLHNCLQPERMRDTTHAMAYLDLDQFKVINDTCGHIAGDELLRQIAQVLKHGLRRHDSLARLGGDEFALLLEDCSLEQARKVVENIRKRINEHPFSWEGKLFRVGVSIGLVSIDQAGGAYVQVLQNADAACYTAKDLGRNRVHVFHEQNETLTLRHGEMQWVSRIHQALVQDQFELYAQRIQPLVGGENDGRQHYEILLRLRQDGQAIPPGCFLGAAERYGITPKIDRWVIRHCFRQLMQEPSHLQELELCAINLSGHSLNDEEFLAFIDEQFDSTGVPREKICFEITETAAVGNLGNAVNFIQHLKGSGCSFALDDFGSGLSSFGYLKSLPVDYLKIDGQFIQDITTDPIDMAMVKSINEVGHVMGKQTIAEFVEDDQTKELLTAVGVDYAQGYALHRPEPLRGIIDASEQSDMQP